MTLNDVLSIILVMLGGAAIGTGVSMLGCAWRDRYHRGEDTWL